MNRVNFLLFGICNMQIHEWNLQHADELVVMVMMNDMNI